MLQVKLRSDTKRGVRIMATVCLYQDTRHEEPLRWMRDTLGIGYVSRRKDGISELRINGFTQVHTIVSELLPFIRFKKKQAQALLQACAMLSQKTIGELSKRELRRIIKLIFVIRNENYKSRSSLTERELCQRLDLTP